MDDGKKRRWFHRRTADAAPANSAPANSAPANSAPANSAPALAAVEPSEQEIADMVARLSDYVHVQVRSGAYEVSQLRELTLQAAGAETDDAQRADEMARQVLSRELQSWREDAQRWGVRTDCDRLDHALVLLAEDGVLVHAGLVDEESLAESMRIRGVDQGCVTFLVTDIWRAIDTNCLSLMVLDSDGQPAGRRSALIRKVTDALGRAELLAGSSSVEGRVDVAMVWRRRPPE